MRRTDDDLFKDLAVRDTASMPAYLYQRPVSDNEFTQCVRSVATSSLVPLVAAAAARYWMPKSWFSSPSKKLLPWALAEIARVSLTQGNEHRQPATEHHVLKCCAAYTSMTDPDLSRKPNLDSASKFILRLAHEQLVWAQEYLYELARPIALFEQTTTPRQLHALTGDWAVKLLGCTYAEYVGIAFLLHTGAVNNGGAVSLDWLGQPDLADVTAVIPSATVREVAARHFIADRDDLKKKERHLEAGEHPDLRRYTFNPLLTWPVVTGLTDDLVVPVPGLLVRKVSATGFYYTGRDCWGDAFSVELGYLFESYVGRQLALLYGASVLPSITYKCGKDKCDSADWLVVFDDVVLLVEVKGTRPTEAVRRGTDEAGRELRQSLEKAVRQLDRTANLIRTRDAAFSSIPRDRPIIGLVVTMEPFHVVNAQQFRHILPSCSIRFKVCSIYELEHIVTIQGETLGTVLLNRMADDNLSDSSVKDSIGRVSLGRNQVIEEAWKNLPWKEPPSQNAGWTDA